MGVPVLLNAVSSFVTMPTGTVKKWMDEKGFGFITPDDGGEDAFCHRSCLDGDEPQQGDQVEYETEYDDRKGKYKCSWCRVTGSGGGGGGGGKGKGKGKRDA